MRAKKAVFAIFIFALAAIVGPSIFMASKVAVAVFRSWSVPETQLPPFPRDRIDTSTARQNRTLATPAAVDQVLKAINPPGSRWKEVEFDNRGVFPIKVYAGSQLSAEFRVTKFFFV